MSLVLRGSYLLLFLVAANRAGAAPTAADLPGPPKVQATAEDIDAMKRLEEVLATESREGFVAALQVARNNFPLFNVGTEAGKPVWRKYQLNTRGNAFDAIRFRAPLDQGKLDFHWTFVVPETTFTWNIVPAKGTMDGFPNFIRLPDLDLDSPELPSGNRSIHQYLRGGKLEPGAEYMLWFSLEDKLPKPAYIALLVLPAREVDETWPWDTHARVMGLQLKRLSQMAQFKLDSEVKELFKADPTRLTALDQRLGMPPIHWTAERGQKGLLEYLLIQGVDINLQDQWFWTPLMRAAHGGSVECIRLLLSNGAKLNPRNVDGLTALAIAVRARHPDVVRLLVEDDANVNIANFKNDPPLHMAMGPGQDEVVKLLLDRGARLTFVDSFGDRCLHRAISMNHAAAVVQLLDRQLSVECRDFAKRTPLMRAVANRPDIIKILLDRGASLQATTPAGETALHLAAQMGQTGTAHVLLDKGAEVNARTKKGETPLYFAATRGEVETCQLLLGWKADKSIPNVQGETPLGAARRLNQGPVTQLLEAGQGK